MEKFFDRAGPMALGSRMRLLSERLTQDATRVYGLYGLDFEPRWLPVLYSLMGKDGQPVVQLAQDIGQSQAAISQVIKDLAKRGIVTLTKSEDDARKTLVTLTDAARAELPKFERQMEDVGTAMTDLLATTHHNLWLALDEFEDALDASGLYDRVYAARKRREGNAVEIVPYTEAYRSVFRDLNVEWITTYFAMEPEDYKKLDHPEAILEDGGAILIALVDGEPLGCCAVVRMDDTTFELSKMAVSPKAQGRHAGYRLGLACIAEAKRLGAQRLYLESNTSLKPAIRLYHKLGFQRLPARSSPYQRANIQMELLLAEAAL